MAWGLPPKYKTVHQFNDATYQLINDSVVNSLMNTDFELTENTGYNIEAVKKMNITFLSFFNWSRPRIDLVMLITKAGRLTINSKYDYNSMFGIAMSDAGKQKREISILLEEIIDIVKRNIEFEKYGTVDGKKI
ncbi:MAG: hypothetical protein P8Q14_08580 [Vicingaceae bacterium]|nr:hypothetical protein [Vicingaceae bacterium]